MLQQREIEARIVAPLVHALRARFGPEVLEVVREVIQTLARETGRTLAEEVRATRPGHDPGLVDFARMLDRWTAGNALAMNVLESSENRLSFDVTRCGYAEMYRRLGIPELGTILSCARDRALIEGYCEAFGLDREGTLLEGASCCDFRFRRSSPDSPDSQNPDGQISGS
ncbi:MAG: L-2-amino-thiazoline-4-carboxylic acid hydrolase [Candidatus Eisenbacteria bacterium]|uniref:L-2-amino-thiazoline-4-carboxylic acid hydrolase n=1 Tax=Eiseniibacteriota bacterium TaxID=2212470 RepID=A0A956RPK4_UNCEI|nr:L-2-amino-thiazoline-4-carboxylic acid hydrolase [Candidatus Eisenbacteria bacterium]